MNSKSKLKPVALAVGAAFATTLAMAPIAQATTTTNATSNPFAMNQLESGFKLAAMDGSCGANKTKPAKEVSCGANKAKKMKESSCSANKDKKMMKESSCGANKSKSMGM